MEHEAPRHGASIANRGDGAPLLVGQPVA
jgi:hypothetical protein